MARMGFCRSDCESMLSQIKHQEKQLKLKRRWLMGLPTSKYESNRSHLRKPKFLKYRLLPESLLREDDIFYDTVKAHVEEVFGAWADESGNSGVQDSFPTFVPPDMTGVLASCIDALSNKGLYLIAMMLSGGSVKFEKTRKKMKKVIKESLLRSSRKYVHLGRKETFTQLSRLLNDPKNFREHCLTFLTPTAESLLSAAAKLLNGLEELPSQALLAMHRKLRGIQAGTLQLKPRYGWSRDKLIHQVRKTSETMLSNLRGGGKLQEPLAKAMAVAALSLKLNPCCPDSSTSELFLQFSPEIKSLQNEIVKAIWLLKTKVRSSELKSLKLLLGPDTDVSNRCLRTAVKKMLTEYLFECSDMVTIPNSLSETLNIINRSSRSAPHRCFPKEEIEEEVECILRVSAQTKQILWDSLPDYEFDQDFTDAYMEELEESDDGDGSDDDGVGCGGANDNDGWQPEIKNSRRSQSHSIDFDYPLEGIGESMPVNSMPTTTNAEGNGPSSFCTPSMTYNNSVEKLEPEHVPRLHSDFDSMASSSFTPDSKFLNGTISTDRNHFHTYSMGNINTPGTCESNLPSVVSLPKQLSGASIERCQVKLETGMDIGSPLDFFSPDNSSEDVKSVAKGTSVHGNQYLTIQEVCDETSMVAYNLVGRILEEFVKEEGLDLDSSDYLYLRGEHQIQEDSQEERENMSKKGVGTSCIVRVVEELMPSLPKSAIDRFKELMGTE